MTKAVRPSQYSAIEHLEGRSFTIPTGNRVATLQAIAICASLMGVLTKQAATEEWQETCRIHNLPPMPEGLKILDRVVMHLELELRKN